MGQLLQIAAAEPALAEYSKYFPEFTPSCFQQDLIEQSVTDLAVWSEVLKYWAGNGYRPQSILKMLDYYEKLKSQPSGDWVGDAVKAHADKDPRLVEIAVIQVIVSRFYRKAVDAIQSINYFRPEIENISTATISSPMIDAILQRRRQQLQCTA